jgi:hypothetical protein
VTAIDVLRRKPGSCLLHHLRVAIEGLSMKTTGPDEFVDVSLEEIKRLSLVQKDRITAADNGVKVSLSHKKEMIKLKLRGTHSGQYRPPDTQGHRHRPFSPPSARECAAAARARN